MVSLVYYYACCVCSDCEARDTVPLFLVLSKSHEVSRDPNKFDLLCDTVNTAMVTLNGALQEVWLPPQRMLTATVP